MALIFKQQMEKRMTRSKLARELIAILMPIFLFIFY
jgi:hypothetical protein